MRVRLEYFLGAGVLCMAVLAVQLRSEEPTFSMQSPRPGGSPDKGISMVQYTNPLYTPPPGGIGPGTYRDDTGWLIFPQPGGGAYIFDPATGDNFSINSERLARALGRTYGPLTQSDFGRTPFEAGGGLWTPVYGGFAGGVPLVGSPPAIAKPPIGTFPPGGQQIGGSGAQGGGAQGGGIQGSFGGFGGGIGGNQGGGFGGGNGTFAQAAANLNLSESPRPLDRVYVQSRYYNTLGKTVEPDFGRTDLYQQTLGFEKVLPSGDLSIGLRLPVNSTSSPRSPTGGSGIGDTSFGDLTLSAKYGF